MSITIPLRNTALAGPLPMRLGGIVAGNIRAANPGLADNKGTTVQLHVHLGWVPGWRGASIPDRGTTPVFMTHHRLHNAP